MFRYLFSKLSLSQLGFLEFFCFPSPLEFFGGVLGFDTQDLGAPLFSYVFVVVEVGSESLAERVESRFIFRSNVGKADSGGVFHVDQFTESGLVLDETVGNVHLSAEGWEPDDQFNGVNIVGDDD